jgi:hypothetical protein
MIDPRSDSPLNAALDYHIQRRTVMTLPVMSEVVSSGQNNYFHVLTFGVFLLRGYGPCYLDLVYVGQPSPLPCTA